MDICTFPCCITIPGKYCIPKDVVFGSTINTISTLIWVKCPGVTIDLLGNSISMSRDYNLINRYFNLIRSKFDITVCNGTIGLCSGYSIKSKGSVHCSNINFINYEIGAIESPYCSLTSCTISNQYVGHTTINYNSARNLIVTCSRMLSKYANKLPTSVKSNILIYMNQLETYLNFCLESYNNGTYLIQYFSEEPINRCKYVLNCSKIKIINSQINITNKAYSTMEYPSIRDVDQELMRDIGNIPIEWTALIDNESWSNLVILTSNCVIDYDLPYYKLPREFILGITTFTYPTGYSYAIVESYQALALHCSDLKIYGSTIVSPRALISYNTRYIRCFNNSITSIMTIDNAKSIKLCSNTINTLIINNPCQVEMEDNIIQIFNMTNVGKSLVIKCK